MTRDIRLYLDDIMESIHVLEDYSHDITSNDFFSNQQFSEIPWDEMSGMRDILIHGYFGVNLERAWNVIEHDLPTLKASIEKVQKYFDAIQ